MMYNLEEGQKINSAFTAGQEEFSAKDLADVIEQEEVARQKSKFLGDMTEDFVMLLKILREYYTGTYKEVPWKFIAAAGFSALYLINPFDVIPDVLPVLGYLDDAAVVGLVLKTYLSEIAKYKKRQENKIVPPFV